MFEYARHPYDPSLGGPALLGRSHPGELTLVLVSIALETVVLALVLRPWSWQRSWRRAVTAFALFTPWLGFWHALSLGSGPVTGTHVLVLLVLWLGLALLAALSSVAFRRGARRQHSSPA